ncbi:hypothetical protein TorRG33x02_094650 [Trema orientale]|uniref:Uncharacterized protein n=1 Tax=Trema orientale TaxID=63057 RepID=A0A2P5FA69_TREOI|nr:hypothetical protein TorRG33x02_094650 [Trema orientale]
MGEKLPEALKIMTNRIESQIVERREGTAMEEPRFLQKGLGLIEENWAILDEVKSEECRCYSHRFRATPGPSTRLVVSR